MTPMSDAGSGVGPARPPLMIYIRMFFLAGVVLALAWVARHGTGGRAGSQDR